jgi:hypothetical protein
VLGLVPLIIGPAILLPLALYAFKRREVRGAMWYGTLLLALAFWSGVYAVELVVDDPAQKLLALKIKYLGVTALPVAWLMSHSETDWGSAQEWPQPSSASGYQRVPVHVSSERRQLSLHALRSMHCTSWMVHAMSRCTPSGQT